MRNLCLMICGPILAGCLVTARAEEYQWTVKGPSKVVLTPHGRLHFMVETTTADGRPAVDVPFVWVVDWVGVAGAEHQGRSYREHHILAKGAPGTAILRILATRGGYEGLVEVARSSFQVEWGEPGASPP